MDTIRQHLALLEALLVSKHHLAALVVRVDQGIGGKDVLNGLGLGSHAPRPSSLSLSLGHKQTPVNAVSWLWNSKTKLVCSLEKAFAVLKAGGRRP